MIYIQAEVRLLNDLLSALPPELAVAIIVEKREGLQRSSARFIFLLTKLFPVILCVLTHTGVLCCSNQA